MSHSPDIKCDLCGYQFKVFSRQEEEIEDREYVMVTNYYPLPEEKAHLVRNYICDTCYHNIGNVVKQSLIQAGDEYLNKVESRKTKKLNEYLKYLQEINKEYQEVKIYCDKLKSINSILELDEQTIKDLSSMFSDKYPLSDGTYYLEHALDIEKITKHNMKKIGDWEGEYNIEISEYSKGYGSWDVVSKKEFKDILLESKINKNTKEILKLIEHIKEEVI